METNTHLRDTIFEIIDSQIKTNDPPETSITFKRLLKEGYSEFEVKQLIGQALSIEIFNAVKHNEPYSQERYLKNLKNLPNSPFE